MAINQTRLESEIQTAVDNLTTSCSAECLLEVAIAANNANTDRQFSLALACDLPDLATSPIPYGTTVFVEELGIPVYTNGVSWKGLDGRTYRTDITAGTLYSAGFTPYGISLRECTTQCCFFPATVEYGPHWTDIGAAGFDRYLNPYGIKSDGTLWTWGWVCYNRVSFLNCSSGTLCASSPIQEISSSNNWVEVAGGCNHGSARKTDGTLWSWGASTYSGDGTSIPRSSPVQEITSGTDWCKMSASDCGTAAIKSDNTLWYFGKNCEGILYSVSSASSPVQELTSSSWCDISLRTNSCSNTFGAHAIKTDGTLWGWGQGHSGQLGHNSCACVNSSPVQEASLNTSWCRVSAAVYVSNAIKTDGTLWGWGRRTPDNTNILCKSSPVQEITSSTNWCNVSSDDGGTMGLKTDGTLWGWGQNFCRVIGDGSVTPRSSPVQEVTSGTDWYYIHLQGHSSYALKQA